MSFKKVCCSLNQLDIYFIIFTTIATMNVGMKNVFCTGGKGREKREHYGIVRDRRGSLALASTLIIYTVRRSGLPLWNLRVNQVA